jgi:hypothetical protein
MAMTIASRWWFSVTKTSNHQSLRIRALNHDFGTLIADIYSNMLD